MKPFKYPIYVTRPFLPPIAEYKKGMEEIWKNKWLTNEGPVLKRFAAAVSRRLGAQNTCLFSNGTQALQIGIQSLKLRGEVITTPFTFAATSHALFMNGIKPVFADIEPDYYTLDPASAEAAITKSTTAILAVHVYGHPCRHKELSAIAKRHNLKLVYDAAHAFGVLANGEPISALGDISMFSFHATKLFHTVEGGMLASSDPALTETFHYLKNFGFENEVDIVMPGTNAKMNEFQALMGLQILPHIDKIIARYGKLSGLYRKLLAGVPGLTLTKPQPPEITCNYSYFPVQIDKTFCAGGRDGLYESLKKYNVFTRRYFYPLLSDIPCYGALRTKDPLTTARGVASRILALPLYYALKKSEVERLCEIIRCLGRRA